MKFSQSVRTEFVTTLSLGELRKGSPVGKAREENFVPISTSERQLQRKLQVQLGQ